MGGTISGTSQENSTTNYHIGNLCIQSLLDKIPLHTKPQIHIAKIQAIANIDSIDVSYENLIQLAQEAQQNLDSSNIDGVVITHGSDTLEESAFFLNLVIKSSKPIVLVAAMRPSDSVSADGLQNLYNALCLCADTSSRDRGVMVVMNDKIFGARDMTKTQTLNLDAFAAPNSGIFGSIIDGVPYFRAASTMPHTTQTPLMIWHLQPQPCVEIVYATNAPYFESVLQALIESGIRGIVIAGGGAGNIPKAQRQILKDKILAYKLIVVRSSRVCSGLVLPDSIDEECATIASYDFNPQKSRILLSLVLGYTNNKQEIAKIFASF